MRSAVARRRGGGFIRVRPMRRGDVAAVARVIYTAIHEGAAGSYNRAQLAAWMPRVPSGGTWVRRLVHPGSFVAVDGGLCVGVVTLRPTDYLDLLYVDPRQVGAGLGRALLRRAMAETRRRRCRTLTVDASLVAERVFHAEGWRVVRRQVVRRSGVELSNVRMRVHLDRPAFHVQRSWGSRLSRRSASFNES